MTNSLAAAARLQLAFVLVVFTHVAAAQSSSSVQDSRPAIFSGQSRAAPATTSNNDALSLLLEQNRQLSTEVQALRNLIEEQGFELRNLQRDSLSRYTNVDQRLSDLEMAKPAAAPTLPNAGLSTTRPIDSSAMPVPTNSASISPTTTLGTNAQSPLTSGAVPPGVASTNIANGQTSTGSPPNRVLGGRGTLQPAVLSEQQLYQMAYDSVINSNFELSIAEFDQYLSIYPQGRFVTNAHYWKGQAYLYLDRFEEARSAYDIILDQYSDSSKLPDAMYGLGLAYQGLGNISQARQLLNEIKRRFPNTGVANLADTRLLSLD
ncbi:MAG: tol-pal system protein YbgF [Pseudohongiellaceae bacterium]|jgi:tol-pal system protein YbgF